MLLVSFVLLAVGASCTELANDTIYKGTPTIRIDLLPGKPVAFKNDVDFGRGYDKIRYHLQAQDMKQIIKVECQIYLPCSQDAGLRVYGKEGNLDIVDCTRGEGLHWTDQYVEIYRMAVEPFSRYTENPKYQCSAEIVAKPRPVPATTLSPVKPVRPNPKCACGRTFNQKIVNGENAVLGEIPWQVSYQLARSSGAMSSICGGTLLSEEWVLTASHCISDIKKTFILFATLDQTQGGFLIGAQAIIGHPYYNEFTTNNDVALIQLMKPVTFSKVTFPACLPRSMTSETFSGQVLRASGWGRTKENGNPSRYLMKTVVKGMSNEDCMKIYGSRRITPGMLCVENTKASGTCQGDSGGPLTYLHKNGHHYVVGAVSWAVGCARTTAPTVFARITEYMRWIDFVTEGSICTVD